MRNSIFNISNEHRKEGNTNLGVMRILYTTGSSGKRVRFSLRLDDLTTFKEEILMLNLTVRFSHDLKLQHSFGEAMDEPIFVANLSWVEQPSISFFNIVARGFRGCRFWDARNCFYKKESWQNTKVSHFILESSWHVTDHDSRRQRVATPSGSNIASAGTSLANLQANERAESAPVCYRLRAMFVPDNKLLPGTWVCQWTPCPNYCSRETPGSWECSFDWFFNLFFLRLLELTTPDIKLVVWLAEINCSSCWRNDSAKRALHLGSEFTTASLKFDLYKYVVLD